LRQLDRSLLEVQFHHLDLTFLNYRLYRLLQQDQLLLEFLVDLVDQLAQSAQLRLTYRKSRLLQPILVFPGFPEDLADQLVQSLLEFLEDLAVQ
jgi:Fic family protein